MAEYSQAELDDLLACPKKVKTPPTRSSKLVDAFFRNQARLVRADGRDGDFAVFMRQSEEFLENFSVGLLYVPNDGRQEVTVIRCNGPHGAFNGLPGYDPAHPHWTFHIHSASESALDDGAKAEKWALATDLFASYEEALQYFVRAINIDADDIDRFFPSKLVQRELF